MFSTIHCDARRGASLKAVLVPPAKGSTAILPGTSWTVLPDEALELDDPMLKDPAALLVLESSCVFVLVPPLAPVLEEVLQRNPLSGLPSISLRLDSTVSTGLRLRLLMATRCHMLPGHLFRQCERHLALLVCAVLNSEASTIMHGEV